MVCFIEEKISTAVKDRYDVIVVGAGPAGMGAAIAASRRGMKTLLIEKFGFAGGMWTAGLINPIFDYQNKEGIIQEVISDLKARNAWGGFFNSCFQYEQMKAVLDSLLITSGVTVLFHTYFSKCIMEDNRAVGVIVENKDGRSAYYAHVIIDCSGDGDAAATAGAEFSFGDQNNTVQAMTTMFVLGNIQYKQTGPSQYYDQLKKALNEYKSDYVIPFKKPYIIQIPERNEAVVQLTHIRNVSGINAAQLSSAEIEGRRQVMETVTFMKTYIPEFENIELLYTAPQIGVRETRRIVGEYTLTKEDLLEGKKFDDGIAVASFGIDIHNSDDDEQEVVHIKPYQIPYRCLIPKNIHGMLVAGRCISGSHEAMASYRVTGNCMAMGEAAGIAASIAVAKSIDVRDAFPL